jgi:hypothetical protein
VAFWADGRQPFRYAPERPTTGKVRVARHPEIWSLSRPSMSALAILHHLRISADFRIADTTGAINADFHAKMFFPDLTLSGQEI